MLDPWAVIERYPCTNVGMGTDKSLDVFLCAAFGKHFSIPHGRLEVRVATYNSSDSKVVVDEMLAGSKLFDSTILAIQSGLAIAVKK
jgi:hypothetical protein